MRKLLRSFKRRKLSAKLHLYFGLLLSLPLLVICITGSLLAFQGEFGRVIYPKHFTNQSSEVVVPLDDIIASFEGERVVNRVFLPNKHRETIAVMYEGENNYYFYNSNSGEFQAKMHNLRGIFKEVMILHRTFFIPKIGYDIVGVITFVFWFFILLSGLWLFWPKKGHFKTKMFRVRKKAFSHTSHKVFGFAFLIPLLVLGITGNFFTYSDPYIKLFKWFGPEEKKEVSLPEPTPTSNDYDPSKAASLTTVWEWIKEQKKQIPASYSTAFMMRNVATGRPIFVSYENYDDTYGLPKRVRLTLEAQTGKIISENHPEQMSDLRKYTSTIVYLHMGKIGGFGLKLLWFLSGLMGAWFCISGIRIWMKKRVR
ncbi:PepSY domain-containing protein [Halosquirtibacter xylanolyticus]|uniref:PepSY-associated TM helix domain-containing protein n=1 Tax=Halosquirtibacter xylanolyticus TaxID=3374599 RepID=UPI003748E9A9|nr:PepSY domain-containing protein [Prolixibacteraceae bacterium]